MRSTVLLAVVSGLAAIGVEAQSNVTGTTTGSLGDATVVTNNPVGPVYAAVLPETEFFNPKDPRGNVKGGISATAGPNGVGVAFTINFSNLPTSGGPFPYHLHVAPVNSSGSCASTLAHLDPFIRGEQPPCDPKKPETCQVGDLSGKYGKITTDPFTAFYVDPYASLVPGLGSFFGNRSFVVHFGNTTRITCASFAIVAGTTPTTTISPNTTVTPTGKPTQFTGSAVSVTASLFSVFGVAVAALFL